MPKLEELYRSVIMDHARYRRNFRKIDKRDAYYVHYKNPTCGDVMTLFIDIKDEKIEDAAFIGDGCSISMASSSIMTELIKGKTLKEAGLMREAMEDMIRKGEEPADDLLGDAVSLMGVHPLRARHNCALMPWQAFDRIKENVH
ncbi:SUF system NifU family Fe-S cluster assembly protein [Bacillus haynesii]|uniref:Fe-S cluster assembly sulfur transfer protein SufU n=1 Tax=Bacillus haynesii TaxID=1925021 RepID=UPI0015F528F2|nr:SUF system NifU family Fe-S cluster assembly protein [Bacillus haynesii]MCY7966039.1 SUF system NifU family Fe-S cluster assembly protein [Bacillus haynesii]MCY8141881.1 SUF system NifU family Fe-S cluster assembly protein [Bacillus haynesii]MCY8225268.1 SUF system NifU family Fe-S cluster assembly protein [Bacillus haynesii]MCY8265167.1 SUF system NifU family Fe-S cluster assembly protein [Bacillus haynesii]MCY8541679.1 SUF system NifU family Fe-S cluster assembly protein [Bacillus haynesi